MPPPTPDATSSPGIDPRLKYVLAIAAGVTVANLYYAHPLLPTIAEDFEVGSGTTSLIVTASQLGYVIGLAFLVPLGDLLTRRRLVPGIMAVTSAALLAASLAPSVAVLIVLAGLIGIGSAVIQVMVPFAAELATGRERGRVIGLIMTGLLTGVLSGRVVSGAIADVAGSWRAPFVVAAVFGVVLTVVLRRELPPDPHRPTMRYGALLRSAWSLARKQPRLRQRSYYGCLAFGALSAFWTSVPFLLARAPFHYGDGIIGLFGLVGVAGALMATVSGRLADAGHTRAATGAFAALMLVSFGILGAGRHSVVLLIAGIVVLDAGFNGIHVLSQHTIYTVAGDTPSRVNAVYMTSLFVGGTAGSAASAAVYGAAGWTAVCLLGAGLCAATFLIWLWAGRYAGNSSRAISAAPGSAGSPM